MALNPKRIRGDVAISALALLVGCIGIGWGVSNLATGAAADEFQSLETSVLRFETYSPAAATRMLQSTAAQDLSACDTHGQRALLLLEMPLADAALRSGAAHGFDRHLQSLTMRARQAVACAPRDSLIWLLLFGLEVEHGRLDTHAFDLLAASYDTSPHEAWVAVRRILIGVPVVLSAPEPIRQRILAEFQDLVRHRFLETPAHAYAKAPAPVRDLLLSRIEQLDLPSQKAFAEALQKFRT